MNELSDTEFSRHVPNLHNGTPKRDWKCACAEQRPINLKADMDKKIFRDNKFRQISSGGSPAKMATTISVHITRITQTAKRLFVF